MISHYIFIHPTRNRGLFFVLFTLLLHTPNFHSPSTHLSQPILTMPRCLESDLKAAVAMIHSLQIEVRTLHSRVDSLEGHSSEGPPVLPPAANPQAFVAMHPTASTPCNDSQVGSDTCAICLDPMPSSGRDVHSLSCSHTFHSECLYKSFSSKFTDHRCGLCGAAVQQAEVRSINRDWWRRKCADVEGRKRKRAAPAASPGVQNAKVTMSQLDRLVEMPPPLKRPKTAGGLHKPTR